MILLPPGFLLLLGSVQFAKHLFPKQYTNLPHTIQLHARSIGNLFSPVHLQGLESRRVSCYALIIGWLLLS